MQRKTKITNIRDIASAAGVSRTAVYHVINNRQGEVSQITRDRILRVIREGGYIPPPRLAPRGDELAKTIGLVIASDMNHLTDDKPITDYFRDMFRAGMRAIYNQNFHAMIFTGSMFTIDAADKFRMYCDGRCDGMLLIGLRKVSLLPPLLLERGTPFVSIGSAIEEKKGHTVDLDTNEALYTLIKHFAQLGHKRISFLPGPSFVPSAVQRRTAFKANADSRGFETINVGDMEFVDDSDQLFTWTERLAAMPTDMRPTAVVCWNGESARYLINDADRFGLSIPKDLSVGCIDQIDRTDTRGLLVTQYRQPVALIAHTAVTLLDKLMDGQQAGSDIILPGEFLAGDTSAAPRG